ncbi:ThiF family adenylyltransferase [Sulfitobacter aestuarii]|uniref:ThiF family adenylyltransferase n=1 Tax=Sulfitobacter aestuarii TaxID=2161676 RepID=A0ABW5U1W8_9RHOB
MSRYLRQEMLPEIGTAGQAALGRAHVLVVGAGGLGCPALQYLTGAGIGRITIVDADTVALSNLHRQILFREGDVGQGKAEMAARSLRRLNGDCAIIALPQRLTPANVDALLNDVDLVLDCADSFAVSYILNDACLARRLPLISASALGMAGYLGGFCGSAPSLRAVFPDLPGRAATCATAGVIGPLVGVIGTMQAQMALGVLTGMDPSPLGRLVTLDLGDFRVGGFRFDAAAEPEQALRFIDPGEIGVDDFVVDLRGQDESPFPVSALARRHSLDDFTRLRPLPGADQRAVLTCRSGLRAWQAARCLRRYWPGDITLIAMGDTPDNERLPT